MIVLLTIFNLDTLNLRGEKHYKQFVILFWFLNWKKRKTFFFYLKRVFAQDWQVCLVNAKKIQTILTIKSFFTLKLVRRFFVWNLNANMQLEERHLLQKCGQTQIGIFETKNHLIANSCFNFIFVSVERKKFLFWWQHSNIPSLTNSFCSEDLIF